MAPTGVVEDTPSPASPVATQIAWLRRFPLSGVETSFGFNNPPPEDAAKSDTSAPAKAWKARSKAAS